MVHPREPPHIRVKVLPKLGTTQSPQAEQTERKRESVCRLQEAKMHWVRCEWPLRLSNRHLGDTCRFRRSWCIVDPVLGLQLKTTEPPSAVTRLHSPGLENWDLNMALALRSPQRVTEAGDSVPFCAMYEVKLTSRMHLVGLSHGALW